MGFSPPSIYIKLRRHALLCSDALMGSEDTMHLFIRDDQRVFRIISFFLGRDGSFYGAERGARVGYVHVGSPQAGATMLCHCGLKLFLYCASLYNCIH